MSTARPGSMVKVHYVGRNARGQVVDTTRGGPPPTALVGGERLVAGLDAAVQGMKEGETRAVVVPPEDGYGTRKQNAVHRVPTDMLPEKTVPGDRIFARTGIDIVEVWVRNVGSEEATLDENHPLAGETIEYVLKLVEVVPC